MVFTRSILPHSTIPLLAWYKQVYQAIMKGIKNSGFNPDYVKVYHALLSCLKQINVEGKEISEFITFFPVLCENFNCLDISLVSQCVRLSVELDSSVYSSLRGLFL